MKKMKKILKKNKKNSLKITEIFLRNLIRKKEIPRNMKFVIKYLNFLSFPKIVSRVHHYQKFSDKTTQFIINSKHRKFKFNAIVLSKKFKEI